MFDIYCKEVCPCVLPWLFPYSDPPLVSRLKALQDLHTQTHEHILYHPSYCRKCHPSSCFSMFQSHLSSQNAPHTCPSQSPCTSDSLCTSLSPLPEFILSITLTTFGHTVRFTWFSLCLCSLEFKQHEIKGLLVLFTVVSPVLYQSLAYNKCLINIHGTNKRLFVLLFTYYRHS